jgi:hypothetical protein
MWTLIVRRDEILAYAAAKPALPVSRPGSILWQETTNFKKRNRPATRHVETYSRRVAKTQSFARLFLVLRCHSFEVPRNMFCAKQFPGEFFAALYYFFFASPGSLCRPYNPPYE